MPSPRGHGDDQQYLCLSDMERMRSLRALFHLWDMPAFPVLGDVVTRHGNG
jgi:hypothetical protein